MTAAATVHVGDIGTEIIMDAHADVSAAAVSIKVEKPNGTTAQWSGTVQDTRYIRYVTVLGDWDQEGEYKLHAFADWGPTRQLHGTVRSQWVRALY